MDRQKVINKCAAATGNALMPSDEPIHVTFPCSMLSDCVHMTAWYVYSLAASLSIRRKRLLIHNVAYPICLSSSICLSVWKVYCGKTADWIRMPYLKCVQLL